MKTLRELVEIQKMTGQPDGELIGIWFNENNMAIESIDIVSTIAKEKIKQQDFELRKIRGNVSCYAGDSALFKKFGTDIGEKISKLIHLFIAGYDIEKDFPERFKWLQETIPTLKCPDVFWNDFYEWLKSKQIYFLGENKNDK